MKWTNNDNEYLFQNLTKIPIKELAIYLNRTEKAIQRKVADLHMSYRLNVRENIVCLSCNKTFIALKSDKQKFCNQSCSTTYQNSHKKYGIKRSKLEIYLEEQLTSLYPNLEVHYNRKDTINSELDIYIPSLNLAFELNGIFHYEPIFGVDKHLKTQNNDQLKFKKCIDNKINLCVIDTSKQKHFNIKSSKQYLDIVLNIINGEYNR